MTHAKAKQRDQMQSSKGYVKNFNGRKSAAHLSHCGKQFKNMESNTYNITNYNLASIQVMPVYVDHIATFQNPLVFINHPMLPK